MRRATLFVIAALVLVVATGALAQQPFTGAVARTDSNAGVIVFQDGRMLQTTADSVIISGHQRVGFARLQPGAMVTVYGAHPVAFRDGHYVALGPMTSPAPSTAIVVPPASSTIVTTAPAHTVTTTPVTTTHGPMFEVSGIVQRTDPTSGVIALTDGRKVHITPDAQVLVGNAPVAIGSIKPGTPVVVRSARPFAGQADAFVPMQSVASGTVVRVDRGSAIVLSDGRVISTTPGTVIMVDNRPAQVTTLTPGSHVVIYENGDAAVVGAPAASPPLIYPEAGLREWEQRRQSP
jgi:hypothetical protein